MKIPVLIVILACLVSMDLIAQPVISEVMPKPVSADGEFVELVNLSNSDSVDLSQVKLKDNLTLTSLIHVFGPKKMAPGGYAVVLDRDYFESSSSGQYNDVLPTGIPVYKTSNASIGNGLGNTTDQLVLLAPNGKDTLSALSWTLPANFPSGYSLEIRNRAGQKTGVYPSENWQSSVWIYGTPGSSNSVPGIPLTDLAVQVTELSNEKPWLGDSVKIRIRILNKGLFKPVQSTVKLTELDESGKPVFESETDVSPPGPGDSLSLAFSVFPGTLTSRFLFQLQTSNDENRLNDTVSILIRVQSGLKGDVELVSVKPDTLFIQTGSQCNLLVTFRSRDLESGKISLDGTFYEWKQNRWIEFESFPTQNFTAFKGEKTELIPIGSATTGRFKAVICVFAVSDPNRENDTLSVEYTIFFPVSDSGLTLTEIMPNPEGTDGLNEFVELMNPSVNTTGDLNKVSLILSGGTPFKLVSKQRFISPGERILIHHPLYTSQTLKLYDGIEDTLNSVHAVTSLPLVMKNTNERVALVSEKGDTLDSFSWISDPGNGVSWEKVIPVISKSGKNWGKSKEHHGTPGWQNSLLPPEKKVQVFLKMSGLTGQEKKSVNLRIKLVNQGRKSVDSGLLSIFSVLPGQKENLFFTNRVSTETRLNFSDSLVAETVFNLTCPGQNQFFARFENQELYSGSDTLKLQLPFEAGSLLINEFLPAGDKSAEFIEFFNPSSYPVFLEGWQVSNSSLTGKITLHGSDLVIQPGEFGVFFRDSTGVTSQLMAKNAWWIKNLPAMKDTGDVIKIYAPGSVLIDSFTYRSVWFGNSFTDYSIEKSEPGLPSEKKENWWKSWDRSGTPGKINSRFPFKVNAAILHSDPVILRPGETKTVLFTVQNRGQTLLSLPELFVWTDSNHDLVPDTEVPLASYPGSGELIGYGISAEIPLTASPGWKEAKRILIQMKAPSDENPDDDILSVDVKSSVNREEVKISEILFDPLQDGNDGKPDHSEYVELFNPGTEAVSLENWIICDKPTEIGNQNLVKIKSKFSIPPGNFGVISADSGFFKQFPDLTGSQNVCILNVSSLNLNADADAVIVKDQWGSVVDSVFYSLKWHSKELVSTKDIALERRDLSVNPNDPLNWSSSVNPAGGTPLAANSVKLPESNGNTKTVWVTPDPFSPDGDGCDDVCELHYRFPEPVSSASVTIFDRLGRKIKDLKPWSLTGPEGVIFWDGKKENGEIAPIGPYIFLTEFMNPAGGKIHKGKNVVILAKKM